MSYDYRGPAVAYISPETERQLHDACRSYHFRKVIQDGRHAIERTFRIRYGGQEEVIRSIIQPETNPDSPPRFWCPGASKADVAANAELFDLPYRRTWNKSHSTISGLANAIFEALCSKDLVSREPNRHYSIQRSDLLLDSGADAALRGGGAGDRYRQGNGGSSSGHLSMHTAPVGILPSHGTVDPPVVNRARTTMLDSRGGPVIYGDSRRSLALSSVDIRSSNASVGAGRYDTYRDPSRGESIFSPSSHGVPGQSYGSGVSDRDAYAGGYRSTALTRHPSDLQSLPRENSEPQVHSGQHGSRVNSGPQRTSPLRHMGNQGHISVDQYTIGDQYGSAHPDHGRPDAVLVLQNLLDEEKRRHGIILMDREEQLDRAKEHIRQLELSHGSGQRDLERRDSEIRSLHEQVQLMTQKDDRTHQDVESLKQELRQSQQREATARKDFQTLTEHCTNLSTELDSCRKKLQTQTAASTAKTGANSGTSHADQMKMNSLLAQLEQAKLRASEFERHAKSVELEKENLRKELKVQQKLVVSLTSQVRNLEWEFGKLPNGSEYAAVVDGSDGTSTASDLDQLASRALTLEDVAVPPAEKDRAHYYQGLARAAYKDRQEVFVLFTSKIADYDIIKMVAHGCEGAVYLVRCKKPRLPDPSRLFALKVMFNIFQMESLTQVRTAFQNEYDILAQLPPHRNIVRLCAFFFDRMGKSLPDLPPEVRERARSMSLFLVMEYVDHSLSQVCLEERVKGEITVMKLIDWAYQVAEALYFLAKHHIVHRDMKLNNVMVSNDGVVKVIDFGFALRLDSTMKLKLFLNMPKGGNPAHLAPEVLNASHSDGEGLCDYSKQPVFEVGVLIYEMLHGLSPFHKLDQKGYSMANVPQLDISKIHVLPSVDSDEQLQLAQDLQRFVHCLVEFDIAKRPTVADMHTSLMVLHEKAQALFPTLRLSASSAANATGISPDRTGTVTSARAGCQRQVSVEQPNQNQWWISSSTGGDDTPHASAPAAGATISSYQAQSSASKVPASKNFMRKFSMEGA